jgi:flagellar biosynthesis protein FliQ
MNASLALEWLREMLWTAVVASGPVVLAIAAVGLLIAIVQAATQVNDQAVAFVPKAVIAVIALVVAGPFMLTQMSEFMSSAIVAMGNIHSW